MCSCSSPLRRKEMVSVAGSCPGQLFARSCPGQVFAGKVHGQVLEGSREPCLKKTQGKKAKSSNLSISRRCFGNFLSGSNVWSFVFAGV